MEKVKTKVRFTSLDVAAMVQNLKRLIGMRATNIYDLNPSTYILKLARSEEKSLLLIENGVRFHTVDEKDSNKTLPSGFTMKFRKFLRSKRLENIRQVGVERVVVLTFGSEGFSNHLILELYSQGNIILTDNNYKILQCIRSHQFNDKVKTAVGEIYPFEYAAHIYLENINITRPTIQQTITAMSNPTEVEPTEPAKKKKKPNIKKQSNKLRDLIFKLIPCLFPAVIENILLYNNIDPDQNVEAQNLDSIEQATKIAFRFLKDFLKNEHSGFLYSKMEMPEKPEDMEYFEYSSYESFKFKKSFVEFKHGTFDSAVAEYYSKYKKSQHKDEEQFEELAWKKFEQIKKDQENRVKKLQEEQDIFKLKAEYIEKNIDDVEAIIKIIKTLEENGYSWDDIKRMMSESRKNGDPLANMIHELNILKRQVSILLGDPVDEEQYCELLPVEINIDYNAYTNATMYYSSKKKNFQKELRTKEASQQVLKIAEKDALKVIEKKKNEQFQKNMPARKLFWFEKFYWFISSEGILVISGRDSHQNELLVKRYMKPGDLYMHSDYGGAASTVIKINNKEVGAPRTTLEEAAIFTVCRSKAWDAKIISGAWWVYHDQVSKSAPTGEFLPTGSFMIRGKRNFVYPNRMEMGITFLFKVDQQSAKRHMNDRKIYEQQKKSQNAPQEPTTMDEKDSEEFAIISLETKVKGPNRKDKNQKGKDANKAKEGDLPQLKKLQSKKSVNEESDQDNSNDDSDNESSQNKEKYKKSHKAQNKQNEKNIQQQPPKQKMRNKRKQMKLQKYLEEQDEEEREVIMKMIGAREMKHMRKDEEEEEENVRNKKGKGKNKNRKKGIEKYFGNQESAEMEQKLNPDKVLFLKKKGEEESEESSVEDKKPKTMEQQGQEGLEKEAQGSEQKEKSQNEDEEKESEDKEEDEEKEDKEEKEKVEQKVEEEEIDEKILDSQLAELFKLVGKIHPEDGVENLVTMCAPYSSIKQNRFKIKLVPGGLKKGKAARNILHYFMSAFDLSEQEKPMIKSVPEQEIINALLGNVKMAGAGLLKLELKDKAEKKEKRKEAEKKERNA